MIVRLLYRSIVVTLELPKMDQFRISHLLEILYICSSVFSETRMVFGKIYKQKLVRCINKFFHFHFSITKTRKDIMTSSNKILFRCYTADT